MKLLSVLVLSLFLTSVFSAEKAGVTVPDKMTIAGKELLLNGMGIRRATIFNIKVYVGSLYVSKVSKDAKEILSTPLPKHISMNFLRDVDQESLVGAWKEGFEAAVSESARKPLMNDLQAFNKTMGNIQKGQSIIINFLSSGVEVIFNGKKSASIGNEAFSKALFSIWFVNARDEDLRDEMLGKI